MPPDLEQTSRGFLEALVSGNAAAFDAVLAEDALMRIARWDGTEVYRPRARISRRLLQERSAWPDPILEILSIQKDNSRVALEFRIQATEDGRYIEHNRSAFLTIRNGQIQSADLYCPEPLPSARRKNWIAPSTLTEDEIGRFVVTRLEVLHQRRRLGGIPADVRLGHHRSGRGRFCRGPAALRLGLRAGRACGRTSCGVNPRQPSQTN